MADLRKAIKDNPDLLQSNAYKAYYGSPMRRGMGLAQGRTGIPLAESLTPMPTREEQLGRAKAVGNIVGDFLPGIGSVKSGLEAGLGTDIEGRNLNWWQRGLAGAGALPVVGGMLKLPKHLKHLKNVEYTGEGLGLHHFITKEGLNFSTKSLDKGVVESALRKTVPKQPWESALDETMIKQAKSDLLKSSDDVSYPILGSAQGVIVGAQSELDRAFDLITHKKNLSDYKKYKIGDKPKNKAVEIYNAFKETRRLLNDKYGETIKLYRYQGADKKIKNKHTLNWATEKGVRAFDDMMTSLGDRKLISRDVPIDDVLAVNVGKKGKYEEFIVLNRESSGFIDPLKP